MKGWTNFLGAAGMALGLTVIANQSAVASNPGFTLQHICPAGELEYEVRVGPSGTRIPQPVIRLPSFVERL